MVIEFSIAYRTVLGQDIKLLLHNKQWESLESKDMEYVEGLWVLMLEVVEEDVFYKYGLFENGKLIDFLNREFYIKDEECQQERIIVQDEWVALPSAQPILQTRPFKNIFGKTAVEQTKGKKKKKWSHKIILHTLPMQQHLVPCITGAGDVLGDWDEAHPLLMQQGESGWDVSFLIKDSSAGTEYKVALYDNNSHRVIAYQTSENSLLPSNSKKEQVIIHRLVNFENFIWKGAGLNVQLSSLRTSRSWGVGEFTDLFPLIDWVKSTGMQLIQLLPINDTTSTFTEADSYPYSAVSAFALHPMYLNVQKIATARIIDLPKKLLQSAVKLNEAPSLNYEEVLALKWESIKLLFQKLGTDFLEEEAFKIFYTDNKDWLLPYAAYCHYRDLYQTTDFTKWEKAEQYDALETELLFTETNKNFSLVAIHLFVQYHLHLQLADATGYAYKNGIVFKADLPIGVGRASADVWQNPSLFNMAVQAGAPPDAFAVKGQNWSFPTYNWEEMKKDNYGWWRSRMGQLSKNFDAVRIDHILGFFRIWSIPMTAVEGILGRFVPAMPITADYIQQRGINFSEERFCLPYITEHILWEKFGNDVSWVKETFLDGLRFKPEFDTQRKIESYFLKNKEHQELKAGLFDLTANVILLKDEMDYHYHFRINIFETSSYQHLDDATRASLNTLYNEYLFKFQDTLWNQTGIEKLEALKAASNNMLLCGEDLGMVPDFVPAVLSQMNILSLQVERMPKKSNEQFSFPENAPFDSVLTPGTHDMSTLREWWQEDKTVTQEFYNKALGRHGAAPDDCTADIAEQIIAQHLYAPAMLSVFLIQDLIAMSNELRADNPQDERINIPANPQHIWNYRMHLYLEDILADDTFTQKIKSLVIGSGRS